MFHFVLAALLFALVAYGVFCVFSEQDRGSAGLLACLAIFSALQLCLGIIKTDDLYQASKTYGAKIEVCEQDLPRSQKCVLIAVPEKKE